MTQAKTKSSRPRSRSANRGNRSTDPIFAAIEAHKAAYAAVSKAIDVTEAARKRFPADVTKGSAQPKLPDGVWNTGAQSACLYYDDLFERVVKQVPNRFKRRIKGIAKECEVEVRSAFKKAEAALERKQRKCGWLAYEQALDAAHDDDRDTFRKMLKTRPTTPEGWRALADYVRRFYESGDVDEYYDESHEFVFKTLFPAAEKLARRAA